MTEPILLLAIMVFFFCLECLTMLLHESGLISIERSDRWMNMSFGGCVVTGMIFACEFFRHMVFK